MKNVHFTKDFKFVKKYKNGQDTIHYLKGVTKAVTEDVYKAALKEKAVEVVRQDSP